MSREEETLHLQKKQLFVLEEIRELLRRIYHCDSYSDQVMSFTIVESNTDEGTMALTSVTTGSTYHLLEVPLAADGSTTTLPSGDVPAWTSSDPVNAPLQVADDGQSAILGPIGTGLTVGASVTLTVTTTITASDGTVTNPTGTLSLTVAAPAVAPVASFEIIEAPAPAAS